MSRKLRRGTDSHAVVGGVCGGIAAYASVDPTVVRLAFVILWFVGVPVFYPYLLLWLALPKDDGEADSVTQAESAWDGDSLHLSYPAPVAPHAFSWPSWLGMWVGGAGLYKVICLVAALLTAAIDPYVGIDISLALPLSSYGFLSMMGLSAAIGCVVGVLERPYAIRCTHSSIQVERPFRKARRIELADLETLTVLDGHLELALHDGEMLRLPAPSPDELESLLAVVAESRRRADAHTEDLAGSAEERERLQRMMKQREASLQR